MGGGGRESAKEKTTMDSTRASPAAGKALAVAGKTGTGAAGTGAAGAGAEKAVERPETVGNDGSVMGRDPAAQEAPKPRKVPLIKRLMAKLRGIEANGAEGYENREAWLAEKVRKAEYFHGMIHKDEIGTLLREEGDVILRLGRSAEAARNVTLSVLAGSKTRHFKILWEGTGRKRRVWVDPDERFKDELALVEAYVAKGLKMGQAGYVLKRPVTRADWELHSDDIQLVKEIGKGAFGNVFLGILLNPPPQRPGQTLPPPAPNTQVAVKVCDGAQESQEIQNKFMKEAEIGRRLCHKNVIRIYGVQCREHPLLIVMEFAGDGSLLGWLRRQMRTNAVPAPRTLLGLCEDAAQGVEYLHKMRILHRDIAARNFLVGQGKVLKIADFGHAKADTLRYSLKTKLRLAFKWCAPEVMESGDFGLPSEVWSLGVCLWEILSCGGEPFPDIPKKDVKARVLGPEKLHLAVQPGWSPATGEIFRLAFVHAAAQRGTIPQVLAAIRKAQTTASTVPSVPHPAPAKPHDPGPDSTHQRTSKAPVSVAPSVSKAPTLSKAPASPPKRTTNAPTVAKRPASPSVHKG